MAEPTVLVIDDDLFMRQLLEDVLCGAGFRVLQACDGVEGWQRALEARPDAILLDLVMPKMDGVATCRHLRSFAELRHTPIIMMTSRTDFAGTVNPFQVGADDYLAKPFYANEVVARLHGNLAKMRALAALDRKAGDYQALLDVSSSVTASLDVVQILRQVAGKIIEFLQDVLSCSVVLVQEDSRSGYIMASSDDPNLAGLRIFLEKYPEVQEVLTTAKPLFMDSRAPERMLVDVPAQGGAERFNTTLAVPLLNHGRVIGVMVIRLARTLPGIAAAEVEFCQLVANLTAPALSHAQQFDVVRERSRTLEDTTAQLRADLAVTAAYQQAFANASEGLAAFDGRGRIVLFNRKAFELTGYTLEEVRARGIITLLGRKSLRQVLRFFEAGEEVGPRPGRVDVSILHRDGLRRMLSVSLGERRRAGDLLVVSFRDVTEKRIMEKELAETRRNLELANERLLRLDQRRAEFFNTASHELRTPVTIMSGYCSLLLEEHRDNLSADQLEYLTAVMEGSERLVQLVNNLLDIARFEAGKLPMDFGSGNVAALVRGLARDFRTLAARHGLEVRYELPERCQAVFDVEQIQRVLVNLVGNAVKFTPAGGVITLGISESDNLVQVMVSDTGKGIPPERLNELFTEFTQVGREDSRKGAGLGLFICRRIIEAHQGRIWAENQPGGGSRFLFTLAKTLS